MQATRANIYASIISTSAVVVVALKGTIFAQSIETNNCRVVHNKLILDKALDSVLKVLRIHSTLFNQKEAEKRVNQGCLIDCNYKIQLTT